MSIIDDLRAAADFLEAHPILAGAASAYIGIYPYERAMFAAMAAECGGDKFDDECKIGVKRTFGRVTLAVSCPKEVTCERVQTGTREVAKPVFPDGYEPTYETVEEPVFEWKCPPSFLALGAES